MIMFIVINIGVYTKKIIKPIVVLSKDMLSMADGDLSKKIELPVNTSEIGQLTGAINKTNENMKNVINAVKQSSSQVVLNSDNLSLTMEETTQSIEGVAKATDELARGCTELAQNVQISLGELEGLGEKINYLVKNANLMKRYSDETSKTNKAEKGSSRFINRISNIICSTREEKNIFQICID